MDAVPYPLRPTSSPTANKSLNHATTTGNKNIRGKFSTIPGKSVIDPSDVIVVLDDNDEVDDENDFNTKKAEKNSILDTRDDVGGNGRIIQLCNTLAYYTSTNMPSK